MTFEEWFNEIELYSLRGERFYNDLDHHNPNSQKANERMVSWLKAAYEAGYEHGLYKVTDDLK